MPIFALLLALLFGSPSHQKPKPVVHPHDCIILTGCDTGG